MVGAYSPFSMSDTWNTKKLWNSMFADVPTRYYNMLSEIWNY
jgi:hypothetical protein